MESFNATYKRECVGLAEEHGGYATRAEATADFFAYAEKYYNRVRRHTPVASWEKDIEGETVLSDTLTQVS